MVLESDTGRCASEEAEPRRGVDTRRCSNKDAGLLRDLTRRSHIEPDTRYQNQTLDDVPYFGRTNGIRARHQAMCQLRS